MNELYLKRREQQTHHEDGLLVNERNLTESQRELLQELKEKHVETS